MRRGRRTGEYMRSIIAMFAMLFVALIAATVPAAAQTKEQIDWCNGKNEATPDLQIGGCTAIIQSGRFSGSNLAIAFLKRGDAFVKKGGKLDDAIADYSQAIRLDAKKVWAWIGRCRAYMTKKDNDRAIADCASAIKLDSRNASAWTYRGDAYSDKKNYDQAILNYGEGIKLDPNWMWPHNDRGWVY